MLLSQALRYFNVVTEERSIRAAAEKLRISQSAISRQIQNLEFSLGTSLLDRGSRGISVTPAGRVVQRYLNESILLSKDMRQELDQLLGVQSGHVSVAIVEGFATSKFPALLSSFRENNPAVTMEVVVEGTHSIQDGLEKEIYDLGVLFNPHSDDLTTHISSRHRLCALMAPNHPLSKARLLTIDKLISYPLVVPAGRGGSRELYEALLRGVKSPISPALETNSAHIAAHFLKETDGVGILSPQSARRYIDEGELVSVPMKEASLNGSLVVASKHGRKLSPAAGLLCSIICRTISEM